MTSYRLAGAACALALVPCVALAVENWTPFFMLKQGVVMIDRNSVEQAGGKVSLTTELWYETPPSLRGQLLNYVRSRLSLNCRAHTFTILEQRFYGMDGQELGENLKSSEPKLAPPGSFESSALSTYCALSPPSSGADPAG